VKIAELTDAAAMHEAAALLDGIWGTGDEHVVDPGTMRALAHIGGYVAGAYDGDTLVGASVGFFAADGHLHSHVTGIAPEQQGRGIGRALKLHQRDWALARGRTAISWTFDPLIARNAYFNLHTLGATAVEYLPDFYGAMRDAVNTGTASDRVYVLWRLDAQPPRVPDLADRVPLLDRAGDVPVPGRRVDRVLTIAIPLDIERLRATDAELAVRWRTAVRDAMMDAQQHGYRIAGISRDGRYLLEERT
jgi:predicted GNAT superfamily acetyltransferase